MEEIMKQLKPLLEQATMKVKDFANPDIRVVRRDEADAILRVVLTKLYDQKNEIDKVVEKLNQLKN